MEKLDLTKILKDCPKGTQLYSPIFGDVTFNVITNSNTIETVDKAGGYHTFCDDGKWSFYENAECVLFPSKDNRDWSTFKIEQPKSKPQPQKFEPKQWVLVRDDFNTWELQIYSHYKTDSTYPHHCICGAFKECIPYEGNESLLGTSGEPKEQQ